MVEGAIISSCPDLGLRDIGRPDLGHRDMGRPDLGLRDIGRPDLGRRSTLGGLLGAALLPAALLPRPVQAGIPTNRRLTFDVSRNDKPIGAHLVTFEPAADGMDVTVAVDFVVRWAGLVFYRYSLRGSETWRGDVLMAAHGETNDDGTRHAMRATRRNGRLVVEGTNGPTYTAPAQSIVSSHWNPAQLAAPMINIQDGELLAFQIDPKGRGTITARGRQVEADHFALTGKASLELWYDRQNVWSKLLAVSWDGSQIEYRQT